MCGGDCCGEVEIYCCLVEDEYRGMQSKSGSGSGFFTVSDVILSFVNLAAARRRRIRFCMSVARVDCFEDDDRVGGSR